jgi:hypothetical protein
MQPLLEGEAMQQGEIRVNMLEVKVNEVIEEVRIWKADASCESLKLRYRFSFPLGGKKHYEH